MDIEFFLVLAGVANRVGEFVKLQIVKTRFEQYAGEAAIVSSSIAGVLMTVPGNLNMFTDLQGYSNLGGEIATGLAIGFGAGVVHLAFDFVNARKASRQPAQ